MHYHWGQAENLVNLNSGHETKKQGNFDSGWNDNRAVYITSSESFESKRFVWCLNQVQRKYIQEQQPN